MIYFNSARSLPVIFRRGSQAWQIIATYLCLALLLESQEGILFLLQFLEGLIDLVFLFIAVALIRMVTQIQTQVVQVDALLFLIIIISRLIRPIPNRLILPRNQLLSQIVTIWTEQGLNALSYSSSAIIVQVAIMRTHFENLGRYSFATRNIIWLAAAHSLLWLS